MPSTGLRAPGEFRATGQASLPAAPSGVGLLTPREHQVVALAASGLRNREIAEKLVLSERTVAAHLHRAFPKLGVNSRAGLRDAPDFLAHKGSEEATGTPMAHAKGSE